MLKLAIAIGLGAAAWFWRDEILAMVEQQFPGIGEKSTRAVENVARSAETAFERVTAREGAV